MQTDTVIRPDLMIICGEQPQRHLEHPPSLMVEVLSESTEVTDGNAKHSIAQENGVKNYLIISANDRTITEASGEQLIDVNVTEPWRITLDHQCRVQIDGADLFD